MKNRSIYPLTIFLLAVVFLSSCQLRPASASFSATATTNPAPAEQAAAEPSPTATALPTRRPTLANTPTPAQDMEAEQAAHAYFEAISSGNVEQAADLLSSFSLMVFQMTRGDAVAELQKQKIEGLRWSDLEVQGTQSFDSQTILIHVTYSVSGKLQGTQTATATPTKAPADTSTETTTVVSETRDELWPFRQEFGEWRYNWNNLIDFRTLEARAQTVNGVTVMPTQLNRYTDRIALTMLIQNRTNAAVVFGQSNETLATFFFGEQAVVAEHVQWVLNPLRSVPAATLEAKGLFTSYPDAIEIRRWKDYNVDPWYVFQLH